MARGLKSYEHDMFPFDIEENVTVQNLIDELQVDHSERFEVYFEDSENRTLRRDAIILVNGANMVSKKGLETNLSEGDLIVFMIAAVGG
jgi:molybdopterin converting factor small subunit